MMIGCQEHTKWRLRSLETPDQIPHRYRTKSVEPGTLKPGTSPESQIGPSKKAHRVYIWVRRLARGLKLACPYTIVRSKYQHQDFATTSLNVIPDLVTSFEY